MDEKSSLRFNNAMKEITITTTFPDKSSLPILSKQYYIFWNSDSILKRKYFINLVVKDCGASNTIFETSTTYGRNIIFKSIILFVSWDTNFSGLRGPITSFPHKYMIQCQCELPLLQCILYFLMLLTK